ncbi:MAG: nuclease-related domain-containing protein, partial [Verrucomicrobiota bacterium]
MAQMFPSRFPLPDEPGRWAELQVYRAFQELDDDWMVFYSVPWQSIRKGRQGDGEADFVLVHGRFGIFVVEVKGGSRIELRDGGWFTWSQGTPKEIKNPFEQAKESKYALLNYLSDRMADLPKGITLGHFVVFPSHQQEGDLGPDGLRSIVCDKEDLRDINSTLSKITSHWNSSKPSSHLKPSHLKTIKQSLAPTVSLKRALRYQIEDIGDELNSLTDRQIEAMRIL